MKIQSLLYVILYILYYIYDIYFKLRTNDFFQIL